MSTGWIAVDLDGTLAHYDKWVGPEHIGTPIPKMVERVKRWLADGKDVRIFTARAYYDPADLERKLEAQRAVAAIEAWCVEQFGRALPVTNTKDYGMVEQWDDRVVQVVKNTGLRADGEN